MDLIEVEIYDLEQRVRPEGTLIYSIIFIEKGGDRKLRVNVNLPDGEYLLENLNTKNAVLLREFNRKRKLGPGYSKVKPLEGASSILKDIKEWGIDAVKIIMTTEEFTAKNHTVVVELTNGKEKKYSDLWLSEALIIALKFKIPIFFGKNLMDKSMSDEEYQKAKEKRIDQSNEEPDPNIKWN